MTKEDINDLGEQIYMVAALLMAGKLASGAVNTLSDIRCVPYLNKAIELADAMDALIQQLEP